MAHWDFIFPYNDEAADWLMGQGYPHPPVRPGNRLPTWAEVEGAVLALGLQDTMSLAMMMDHDGDCLKGRGDLLLELRVVHSLCQECGQLWIYPDTGLPAIVVDAFVSPEGLAEIWLACQDLEDNWQVFHERAYGAATVDPADPGRGF